MKNDYISTQGTKPTYIGGQAVIEGVMMRGKSMYAMAVRGANGGIVIDEEEITPWAQKNKTLALPIIRGVVAFVESLALGMGIITKSAEMAGMDFEDEEPSKFEKFITEKFGDKIDDFVMGLSIVMAVILAVGLFMVLPTWIGGLFNRFSIINNNTWALGIIEGIIRLIIFVLYVYLISLNDDIKRVYMYHGAEHKTINCMEHEEELTVENVRKYSRFHRRCGTSFLILVMIVSMVFFLFVRTDNIYTRTLTRIIFVPLIAGVSYELIRWAGKSKSKLVDIISFPGVQLQRLTTKEPEDEQIECAIAAMKKVVEKDK